jgi:hypothetical protein
MIASTTFELLKVMWMLLSVWFWNIAHNTIVHPFMPFLPKFVWKPAHDWTAYRWSKAELKYKEYDYWY